MINASTNAARNKVRRQAGELLEGCARTLALFSYNFLIFCGIKKKVVEHGRAQWIITNTTLPGIHCYFD